QDVVHARLKSTRRLLFLIQTVLSNSYRDLRTDSESILSISLELYLQISIRRKRTRVIAIDESFVVDIADNEVERSVAVQIAIRCAARDVRRIQTPRRRLIRERQVAFVAKRVIGKLGRRHGFDETK